MQIETITEQNLNPFGSKDMKHIIITYVYHRYVFNAQDFERYFYNSEKLKKLV